MFKGEIEKLNSLDTTLVITIESKQTQDISFILFFYILLEQRTKQYLKIFQVLEDRIQQRDNLAEKQKQNYLKQLNEIYEKVMKIKGHQRESLVSIIQNDNFRTIVNEILEEFIIPKNMVSLSCFSTIIFQKVLAKICQPFPIRIDHLHFYSFSVYQFFKGEQQLSFYIEQNKEKNQYRFILTKKIWNYTTSKIIEKQFQEHNISDIMVGTHSLGDSIINNESNCSLLQSEVMTRKDEEDGDFSPKIKKKLSMAESVILEQDTSYMEEESEIFDCNLLISNKQNITHELTADYSENFEAKEVKEIKPEPSKKIQINFNRKKSNYLEKAKEIICLTKASLIETVIYESLKKTTKRIPLIVG